MGHLVEVARVGELDDGSVIIFTYEGQELMVARVKDSYYCVDNRCPHMGGNLSKGTLDGTVITCPKHHSQFDIKDGSVIRWTDWSGLKLTAVKIFKSPKPLITHEVTVEGENIMVSLD